jgi:mono/diheme cytochrome c family protein
MASRLGWFVLGIVGAIMSLGVGAYAFVRSGGVPMATTAAPLPFERGVAGLALDASVKSSLGLKNPRPLDESNLMAGAHVYHQTCAVCHGSPGTAPTAIAKGMFPNPPEFFTPSNMVAGDPVGETYW